MNEETIIRTAVVTGGSRGIGRAVCVQLARQGCHVVVNYCHGEAAAAETVSLCRAEGAQAVAVQADVSTAEGCKKLFEEAVNAFGRVDILVNNAGITRDNLILRMSEADFDAVLDANLKGAFLCCKEAARRMVRQRWGRIINLSSVVALRGNAGQTNYAASKAGLIGLTKSLARELASRNVTVNAVAPGFIETDMTAALPEAVRTEMAKDIPAGRAGQPEDVANAAAFFAAEPASLTATSPPESIMWTTCSAASLFPTLMGNHLLFVNECSVSFSCRDFSCAATSRCMTAAESAISRHSLIFCRSARICLLSCASCS